jgi:hypothetical protein
VSSRKLAWKLTASSRAWLDKEDIAPWAYFDLFSNDKAEEAAQQRNQGLQQGYQALGQDYTLGRNALTTGFGQAGDLYKNLLSQYGGGAGAYGDAAGANGPEGFARAKANFQTDPGYGFQMDQGQQALNRSHAAAGNLSSGNADADTLKFSQGLADQSYGNYVSRLAPYLQGQQNATAGAANAAAGLGGGLNQSYMGEGNAANANYTGQGASTAAATMNNYNVGANQLGAITAAAQLAMGMPPTSLGSIGSSTPLASGAPIPGAVGPTSVGSSINGPQPLFAAFS